jgi:predicted nucleic acid-binding protein
MRRFLDTSTLVWLYDDGHARNHEAARAVIHAGGELVVSTNVLGELFVALTKKRGSKAPLATIAEAARRVRAISLLEVVSVTKDHIHHALDLRERHQVSWWDALNWSSA